MVGLQQSIHLLCLSMLLSQQLPLTVDCLQTKQQLVMLLQSLDGQLPVQLDTHLAYQERVRMP